MSEDAKSFVDSIFKNAGTPTTPSKKWLMAGGVAGVFLLLTAALAYYLFLNPNSPISTILPIKQTEETTSTSFPADKTDAAEESKDTSKAELKIAGIASSRSAPESIIKQFFPPISVMYFFTFLFVTAF